MESIESYMMVAFVIAMMFSLWKVYSFVPKKPLADDDTTPEATEKLLALMLQCVAELFESTDEPTEQQLFERMISHETFDKAHFWRFNPNRLNQLLQRYYLLNPDATSLRDIYTQQKQSV